MRTRQIRLSPITADVLFLDSLSTCGVLMASSISDSLWLSIDVTVSALVTMVGDSSLVGVVQS